MKIASLETFDISAPLLERLLVRHGEGAELLPVQEKAVREHGLLAGQDLLVFAPTSAGKTLVAELAMLRALSRGEKALLVMPTRALVEEKVALLEETYGDLGLRVVAGTRDRREHDYALRHRRFDVAVVVYEKLASLLVGSETYLDEVGVLCLDELQLLWEPNRGWHIQWILHVARERRERGGRTPQIVGLSAALSEADEFARWLDLPLLHEPRRPVPLRTGVLHCGVLHYRDGRDGSWARETLVPDLPSDFEWLESDARRREEMIAGALRLAGDGERVVCFAASKHDCHALAQRFARDADGPAAEKALARLEELPPSVAGAHLERMLRRGVAFHHGDLQSDLRVLIEEAAREGEVRLLCATSTLAMGVNLPADTVFVDPRRWYGRDDEWASGGISRVDFEAMAGRAGRFLEGATDRFGRAILCASSVVERDALIARHVHPTAAPPQARRDGPALGLWLLRLACRRGKLTSPVAREALGRSSHAWLRPPDESVDSELAALGDGGLLEGEDGAPSVAGRVAAALGLTRTEAAHIGAWVDSLDSCTSRAALLHGLCGTRPARSIPLGAAPLAEQTAAAYLRRLRILLAEDEDEREDGDLELEPESARRALILLDWIADGATCEIENRHRVLAGAMDRLARECGRLLDGAWGLLRARGSDLRETADALRSLGITLSAGAPERAASLASIAPRGLPRDAFLALAREGLDSPESIVEAPVGALCDCVPSWLVQPLLRRAAGVVRAREERAAELWDTEGTGEEPVGGEGPFLRLHRRRPNEVVVRDRVVPITGKQFSLLSALAERPSQYVSFDELYDAMWSEGLEAEPGQIGYHKRLLVARLAEAVGKDAADAMIESVRGKGLMLTLPPERVRVEGLAAGA